MERRESVIFNGTLRGQGRERSCLVKATKITREGFPPAYIDYSIANSDDYPDGNYVVEIKETVERIALVRKGGAYLARGW